MKARVLGRYEILDELGRGTMGVVYRARDPVIDREVALKTVVIPDAISQEARAEYLQRFFLEARIAGKLVHPSIVITYDAATDEERNLPFIAMELVRGESLASRLKREGRLDWRTAVDIVAPLAQALSYASSCGVVHRDVKPANVLLSDEGSPKLTDFGIARLPTSSLTRAGVILGTPAFISPEQLRGKALDGRADLYSLGAVLYNLLVGEPPFKGPEVAAIFHQLLSQEPVRPSQLAVDVPAGLDRVVARVLAKAPDDRYPSGAELARDLLDVRHSEDSTVRLEGRPEGKDEPAGQAEQPDPETQVEPGRGASAGARRPRRRWMTAGMAAALLAALAYAVFVGPDRVADQARSLGELTRPAWSWLAERSRVVESSLRDVKAEREQRVAAQRRATELLQEGERLRELGQYSRAQTLLDESLETWRSIGDGAGESLALAARGTLMAGMGRWGRARADLEAAEAVARLYDEAVPLVQALTARGSLERDIGGFQVAEQHLAQAFQLAQGLEEEGPLVSVLIEQSMLSMMRGRWVRAVRILQTAREGEDGSGSSEASRRLLLLGAALLVEGDQAGAEQAWAKAAEPCVVDDSDALCAEIMLLKGRARMIDGDPEAAAALLSGARKSFLAADHLPGLAAALECLLEVDPGAGGVGLPGEPGLLAAEAADVRARLGLGKPVVREPALAAAADHPEQEPWRRLVVLLGALPRTALSESQRDLARSAWERLMKQPAADGLASAGTQ